MESVALECPDPNVVVESALAAAPSWLSERDSNYDLLSRGVAYSVWVSSENQPSDPCSAVWIPAG